MTIKIVKPPFISSKLLSFFLNYKHPESMQADYEEIFHEISLDNNRLAAHLWYWIQIFLLIPPFINNSIFWSITMLKNYFTSAFRNIIKNKTHFFINIFGLATGLACCILIMFFVHDEISYDHFHKNIGKIFHIDATIAYGPSAKYTTQAKMHIGPMLTNKFAEVENYVRAEKDELILKSENTLFKQDVIFVDQTFFDVFTFPLIAGDPDNALKESHNVIISETTAGKYFGTQNPIGKTLSIKIKDEFQDFIVTGVTKAIPSNSSIKFDLLINLHILYGNKLAEANSKEAISTFILLSNEDKEQELVAKFPDMIDKELQIADIEGSGYSLSKFKNHYLDNAILTNVLDGGSKPVYSIILSGIALLVLLIACFNFTNLSIASASGRFKEIGMRKVLGAYKKQIAKQFLFESLLQSFLALIFGITLAWLLLPAFNLFSMKSLSFDLFSDGIAILLIIGLCLFVSIIAGGYPSIVFSRFSSIELFNGKLKLSRKNIMSRILIVLQFSISISLVAITLFMHRQYNFMIDKELGYNCDQVIGILLDDLPKSAKQDNFFYNAFKNNLLQHNSIRSVAGSNSSFTRIGAAQVASTFEGERFILGLNVIDYYYIPTLEMQLVKGRNFSESFPGDLNNSIIVNETFIKQLGIESPIGSKLSEYFKWTQDHTIVGVLKDYNVESLSNSIRPAIFCLTDKYSSNYRFAYIKIKGDEIKQTIALIENEFKSIVPDVPFTFNFVDESVAKQYENEKRWSQIITYASILAIFIACSGLFSLTLLIVTRRTKEIGIRKVLGASISSIIKLINKEFIWLVVIANVVAWPVAYYVMNSIFQSYAYHISLNLWVFILAGGIALMIAIMTVSFHAIKAAKANPTDALRYE